MTPSGNVASKRGEDKTIEEVQREGGVFNINDSQAAHELPNGTLRLLVWPGMGARMLSTHSARLKPGQAFEPHVHAVAEDVILIFRGKGRVFLHDRWHEVTEGDLVFAPAGVKHGFANPAENTEDLITMGTGTPPMLDLYEAAGYLKDNVFTFKDK